MLRSFAVCCTIAVPALSTTISSLEKRLEEHDLSCGEAPPALNPHELNVMLVGDSISMPVPASPGGYGLNVRSNLTKLNINVWHNGGWGSGGQAAHTGKGLKCTDPATPGGWLSANGTYDAIHFNFGLHDLKVSPDPEHVELKQYGKNIAEIYRRFAAKAKHVIFATTTPNPSMTTSAGRTESNILAYNREALASLPSDALVDNLHDAVVGYCGLNYSTCDLQLPTNVHFTEKGCEFLGEHVTKSILEALRAYTYSKIGPGGCRTPEEKYPSGTTSVGVQDVQECFDLCLQQFPHCASFGYNSGNQHCALMTFDPSGTNDYPDEDCFAVGSSLLYEPLTPIGQTGHGCASDTAEFPPHLASYTQGVHNHLVCETFCSKNPMCGAYEFSKGNNHCALYSRTEHISRTSNYPDLNCWVLKSMDVLI